MCGVRSVKTLQWSMAGARTYDARLPWRLGGLGFTALLAQVLLIREAGVWLRGNELIIGAMLAAWLAWGALGSMAGYWYERAAPGHEARWLAWLLAVLCALLELLLLRCCWPSAGNLAGAADTMGRAVVLSCAITALPSALHGFVCGTIVRRWEAAQARSIARLYLWETLGAALAGALVTFVLIPLGCWWASVAVMALAPALVLSWNAGRARRRYAVQICAGVLLLAAWRYHEVLEARAQAIASRFLTGRIVAFVDTPKARIAVTRCAGEHAFYSSGRLVGSSLQREYAEELACYALLGAETPRRALVLGFPYNGLVRELAARGSAVTVLDPARAQMLALREFLLPEDAAALALPQVTVAAADSRAWLASAQGCTATFDIILQDIGLPESYAMARYYSREWFMALRARLADDGVLVVALPGSAGHVPDDLARIIARVRGTLHGAYAQVLLVPAASTLLIAAPHARLGSDVAWWQSRAAARGMTGAWFSAALLDDHLQPWRTAQFVAACARIGALAPHTDMTPRAYGDALRYYEARFSSTTHAVISALYGAPLRTLAWAALGVACWLAAAYAAVRARRPALAAWLQMTALSAAGFVAQMTVVIRFVVQQGSVYYALGALFASFMAGLALATWWCDKHAVRARSGWRLAPLAALLLTLLATLYAPWPAGIAGATLAALLLNMAAGACVGAFVAQTAWDACATTGGGIAVYAADLCGALAGALAFSIIIPPALGFAALAALVMALLAGLAALHAWPHLPL